MRYGGGMDGADLDRRMVAARADEPRGEQRALVLELARLYEGEGLCDGGVFRALHKVCPDATKCWEDVPEGKPEAGVGRFDARSEKGCIFLPWVGPEYRCGGVCVLGMNLRFGNGDWEFAVEHRIALDPQHGQKQALRTNRRAHRSHWAKGTMQDVAAVLRSRRGDEDVGMSTPAERASALLVSARIQAVKCSPARGRSSPTPAMNTNCPRRFLPKEIDILKPSVVLAYGRPAHDALATLGAMTAHEKVERFRRSSLTHAGSAFTVFLLTHPAHGGWHATHDALVASLKAHPVR